MPNLGGTIINLPHLMQSTGQEDGWKDCSRGGGVLGRLTAVGGLP